jgi:hypothetical protein
VFWRPCRCPKHKFFQKGGVRGIPDVSFQKVECHKHNFVSLKIHDGS